ncbi:MAG: M20 family metallopeptidase [Victivallaceae bacterium]|nr:M20 family metallopeptidase [Victivallaceae bacterium]
MNGLLETIVAAVEKERERLVTISQQILARPELGHEEKFASKLQMDYLAANGFEVTANFGGLATAFTAKAGTGKPKIAVFSEYDALPQLGHACGHHLITLSALAAAVGIKAVLEKFGLEGTVELVGSPAEEALGGKVDLIRAGVLDDIDFALITHPFDATNTDPGDLAVGRYDVIYHGKAAHAAVSPELGINALDAQVLLLNAVALWRQQLPSTSRVHGTITNGGGLPNVIPEYTSSFFYVRSVDNRVQKAMEQRFEDIAKGAALMTGCRLELNKYPNSYAANKDVPELDELSRECAEAAGFKLSPIIRKISTDFADVTLRAPGVNLFFDVVGDGSEVSLHSEKFLEYAGKPFAFDQALRAGSATALCAARLFTEPELRNKVRAGFDAGF